MRGGELEGLKSFGIPILVYTVNDGARRGLAEHLAELGVDGLFSDDPALVRLAKIVHAADVSENRDTDPLGPGLLAIGEGGLDAEADDHALLGKSSFVYDALVAWCRRATA